MFTSAPEPGRVMRELVKSALSFSWALSLLTVSRTATLLQKARPEDDILAPLTQAATSQLTEFMREIHRSGDIVQARIVDSTFVWINPATWLNPKKWSSFSSGTSSSGSPPPLP